MYQYTQFAICILYFILPWKSIVNYFCLNCHCGKVQQVDRLDLTYEKAHQTQQFNFVYDQCNPVTQRQALLKFISSNEDSIRESKNQNSIDAMKQMRIELEQNIQNNILGSVGNYAKSKMSLRQSHQSRGFGGRMNQQQAHKIQHFNNRQFKMQKQSPMGNIFASQYQQNNLRQSNRRRQSRQRQNTAGMFGPGGIGMFGGMGGIQAGQQGGHQGMNNNNQIQGGMKQTNYFQNPNPNSNQFQVPPNQNFNQQNRNNNLPPRNTTYPNVLNQNQQQPQQFNSPNQQPNFFASPNNQQPQQFNQNSMASQPYQQKAIHGNNQPRFGVNQNNQRFGGQNQQPNINMQGNYTKQQNSMNIQQNNFGKGYQQQQNQGMYGKRQGGIKF